MRKIGFRLLVIILTILAIGKTNYTTNAIGETKVNLIFDKITYTSGETIRLSINLENFSNLNETRIIIKINEKKLIPLKINNQYGQLINSSIYEEALLNEYVNGGYLRFHLIKKSLTTGYYSGYKNNIGEFYFEAKDYIANIYELFKDGSFETLSSGINITLYDIFNQNIPNIIQYSEKMQVSWNVDKYIMEVYEEVPNYMNDIKIINRNQNDYEIIYQSTIDNCCLTIDVLNIVLLDKTNGDYILISKPIEIVDITPPAVTGINNIEINSSELKFFSENDYFEVVDNYDSTPLIDILYYDSENNLLSSQETFKEYLNHNLCGYIQITARDKSSNISDLFNIEVKVVDDIPPSVTIINNYELLDTDLASFRFENLITVTDLYDKNPTLVFKSYVDNKEVDYISLLKKGQTVNIKYFATDNANNSTPEYSCVIKVIDTTKPSINELNDIEIKDSEVVGYDYLKGLVYNDNIDKQPKLIVTYFLNNQKTDYDNWIKGLSKGLKGYFEYYVVDNSQNMTDIYRVNVMVIDTIPPIIRVHNIKSNTKYTKIDQIKYEIIDNFQDEITKLVTINDVVYDGYPLNEPGEYTFKIVATDASGNTSEEIIEFTIIKDNFVGCGDDVECYMNNYFDVVIIVCILMIIILTIIIIKVAISHKKKKLR